MFRFNALQKISSPEDLTKNIQITNYWYWLLLLIMGAFLAGFIAWACVADISTRIRGSGIFLPYGGRVVDASAPFTDTLEKIFYNPGDYVEKGDTIAQFRSSARQKALSNARRNLLLAEQLHEQNEFTISEDRKRRSRNLSKQTENLSTEIETARTAVEDARKNHEDSLTLFNRNLITQTTLTNKRQAYTTARSELHAMQTRLDRLNQAEFEKRYQEDLRLTELRQSVTREEARRQAAVQNLDELKVLAPVEGEVLEIKAPEGALLQAGTPFMSIMTNTVKRNFTSIVMVESGIGDDNLGLLDLVQTNQRAELEFIAYVNAADGKRITRGTELQIEVDYLNRNEFGMVEGIAVNVSELPITAAGIESKLANRALVNQFTQAGSLYEVRVKLKRDPASKNGLAWTSPRGAEESFINIGSLGRVEFILEKRKPITMLIPLLRSFFV